MELASPVYSDEFLEISRGGASVWPGRGRLVALMLRTTESAGVYRLAANGWRLRKTAQSDIREILPKVMLLHYVRAQPIANEDLEISMPAEEDALMSLEEDSTFHGAPSPAPFEAQKLEIAGVVFWGGAAWPRRLLAAIQIRLDAHRSLAGSLGRTSGAGRQRQGMRRPGAPKPLMLRTDYHGDEVVADIYCFDASATIPLPRDRA